MRVSTAVLSALVATSSTAMAVSYAQSQSESQLLLQPGLANLGTDTQNNPAEPAPTQSAEDPAPATPTPMVTESSSPSPSATEPSSTSSPSALPVVTTANSDPIDYKYGTIQISLEKTDGKITDIGLLQADATKGRDAVYRDLVTATLEFQGVGYGNISGATFTVEAFKKAVENALTKF